MRKNLRVLFLGFFCGACFFASSAFASGWNSYLLNKEAVSSLEKEAYAESLKSLFKALEIDPLNPVIHLNLGLVFFGTEDFLKAAKAFGSAALLAKGEEEKFVAYFNQAVSYAEAKKVDSALKSYQKALEIHPESLEVKTNIELLLSSQQNQQSGQDGQSDPNQDQGEGGGKGSDDENQQQNDQQQQEDKGSPPEQKKPQEFKSEELTASDVKKILEELKSQEQSIRAKEYEKGPKEKPSGQDW